MTILHEVEDLSRTIKQHSSRRDRWAFPDAPAGHVLMFTVVIWREGLLRTARAIVRLLKSQDPQNAAVLLRLLREKALDICLLASWTPSTDAAIRANVAQRLRMLAATPASPPDTDVHQQLDWFRRHWPELVADVELAYRRRRWVHWSGLLVHDQLQLAHWPEPPEEERDALNFFVHGSVDLLWSTFVFGSRGASRTVSGYEEQSLQLSSKTAGITRAPLERALAKLAIRYTQLATSTLDALPPFSPASRLTSAEPV